MRRKDMEIQTDRRSEGKELDLEKLLADLRKGHQKKGRSKKNRRRDK